MMKMETKERLERTCLAIIRTHSPIVFEEILPDYLIDLIEQRVSEIEEEDWETGEVGNDEEGGEYPESRQCDVSWIAELDWVSTIFTHYFHIANREIFEYDLTEMESFKSQDTIRIIFMDGILITERGR